MRDRMIVKEVEVATVNLARGMKANGSERGFLIPTLRAIDEAFIAINPYLT